MRRLPVVVAVACLAAIVTAFLIPQTAYSELLITVLFSLFGASYVLVGALIATRRSENPVGWLMLAIGVLMTIPVLLGAYAGYALLEDPSLPWGRAAAWVTSWIYLMAVGGINLLVLVFPDGRIGSGFLRWVARLCVAAWSVAAVVASIAPGPLDGFGQVANPLGLPWLSGLLDVVGTGAVAVGLGTFLVAIGSIFVRLRAARGAERQQLKWFAYATVMTGVADLPNLLPMGGLSDTWVGLAGVVVSLVAIPVGVALAILRAGLYDIDRIISRTLVYGLLTATLVSAYLVSVLLARLVLDPLTGGSALAVAGSTLAVAALFRPARARIQVVVDRRFYRSRYDAARTVEAFAGRLRQEVDLDAVSTDLSTVVREAVQPVHVSLWLRGAER